MRKTLLVIAFLSALPGFAYGHSGFNGAWSTTDFKPGGTPLTIYLSFRVDGTKANGTISRYDAVNIRNGAVDGQTITFNADSADGERTVSFVGKLSGDAIAFTRSVRVHDKNGNTGSSIFGAKGPMQFRAKRDASASTGLEAQYGSWKLNVAKSHYDPSSAMSSALVPRILSIRMLGDGKAEMSAVFVSADGSPAFNASIFKTDGNDYPVYTQATVDSLLAGAKPTLTMGSNKVIDANSAEVTFKANNAVVRAFTSAVSQDGQTLTQSGEEFDGSGKQVGSFVEVYDRIP